MTEDEAVRSDWDRVGRHAPEALGEASRELHQAVQLVASAGQSFAEPADDDSHRAMSWSPALRAFVGAPFAAPYPLRVALRPDDLALMILDRTEAAIGTLPLAGQSLDEAYEWLGLAVATYFGGAPPRIDRPEYDIPEHPVGRGARFRSGGVGTSGPSGVRDTLAALYGSAAALLADVAARYPEAGPVRCWPHHFDIATLITVAADDTGTATRTVGVGMAPAGGGCDHWYWYVSPWPAPDREALPELPLGAWHTEGWTGAVLTGEEIVETPSASREEQVAAFVARAIDAARSALGVTRQG
jgi:hypothetical protein